MPGITFSPELTALFQSDRCRTVNSHKSLIPLYLYLTFRKRPETLQYSQDKIRRIMEREYEISIERQALGRVLHTLADAGCCSYATQVTASNSRNSLAPLFLYFILSGSPGVHFTQARLLSILEETYHVTMNRQALGRILHTLCDSGLGFSMDRRGSWYDVSTAA